MSEYVRSKSNFDCVCACAFAASYAERARALAVRTNINESYKIPKAKRMRMLLVYREQGSARRKNEKTQKKKEEITDEFEPRAQWQIIIFGRNAVVARVHIFVRVRYIPAEWFDDIHMK